MYFLWNATWLIHFSWSIKNATNFGEQIKTGWYPINWHAGRFPYIWSCRFRKVFHSTLRKQQRNYRGRRRWRHLEKVANCSQHPKGTLLRRTLVLWQYIVTFFIWLRCLSWLWQQLSQKFKNLNNYNEINSIILNCIDTW